MNGLARCAICGQLYQFTDPELLSGLRCEACDGDVWIEAETGKPFQLGKDRDDA